MKIVKGNHKFYDAMAEKIISGLRRRAVTSASKWATTFRVMGGSTPHPGPWSFKHHPWLLGMHDSTHERNVGQKAAQVGYTETVLNLTFYNIDVKQLDCLYVLPAKTPDASDFSSGRFNQALELSPHLTNLFSDVQNVGHKRAGAANMYIRGSKSRSALKAVPISFIVLDEVDEMDQDNIELALQRVAGQSEFQSWMISTPTRPGTGINKYFMDSTQDHFMFKCPMCSKFTELIFPDCLKLVGEDQRDPKIEESCIICKECKGTLRHEDKSDFLAEGVWESTFSNRSMRGFYVNQLYSMANAVRPPEIAKKVFQAQHDPAAETELFNSMMGMPHVVKGAQITDEDLKGCIGGSSNKTVKPKNGFITMGIDVGKYFHYVIGQWHLGQNIGSDLHENASLRLLEVGKVTDVHELFNLMATYGVHSAVIDRHPEPRTALVFANRFYGHVRMCMFGQGISQRDIKKSDQEQHSVLVDRTSWIDEIFSRVRRGNEALIIPYDAPVEYHDHMKVLVRLYKKDKDGNPYAYYDNGGFDDHYAFAMVYNSIALTFCKYSKNTNINVKL